MFLNNTSIVFVKKDSSGHFIKKIDDVFIFENKPELFIEMFEIYQLELPNLFNAMYSKYNFEKTAKDRLGCNFAKIENMIIPIVRTTSSYLHSTLNFDDIHRIIIDSINSISCMDFNNSMVELYQPNCRTMGFHSDQSLDLEDNSYICIFSCYNNPNTTNTRKMIIKRKCDGKEQIITLLHNSIIIFSTKVNSKYLHKIVLDDVKNSTCRLADDLYIGVTLRKSKTLINYQSGIPRFLNETPLTLATEEERIEFFKLKGNENSSIISRHFDINYTLSEGDLLFE